MTVFSLRARMPRYCLGSNKQLHALQVPAVYTNRGKVYRDSHQLPPLKAGRPRKTATTGPKSAQDADETVSKKKRKLDSSTTVQRAPSRKRQNHTRKQLSSAPEESEDESQSPIDNSTPTPQYPDPSSYGLSPQYHDMRDHEPVSPLENMEIQHALQYTRNQFEELHPFEDLPLDFGGSYNQGISQLWASHVQICRANGHYVAPLMVLAGPWYRDLKEWQTATTMWLEE